MIPPVTVKAYPALSELVRQLVEVRGKAEVTEDDILRVEFSMAVRLPHFIAEWFK